MKKFLLAAFLSSLAVFSRADSKVSALTADTTAQAGDLLYKVDNPAGTPISRSITVSNLLSQVAVSSLSASGVTAGSYTNTNLTVTAQGIISSASNGSAGSGYALEPATVTIQSAKGEKASTMTITSLSPGVMHIVATSSNVATGLVSLSTETTGNYVANANTNASMTGGTAGSAGASLTLGVDSSSGTLQGNTFNSANKLLQLDGSALVPSAQIPTNLSAYIQARNTLQSGATAYPAFLYAGSTGTILGRFEVDGILQASATAITNAAGLLDATKMTGTVPVANGGTNVATLASNGVLYGNGTGAVQVTASGANGTFLRSSGGTPFFSAILSTDVPSGSSNYVQNTNSLQSGATFFTSSGTAQNFYTSTFTAQASANGTMFTIKNATSTSVLTFNTTPAGLTTMFQVKDSTGRALMSIDGAGHLITASTAPTLSSCGTSPTLSTNSSDFAGTITPGATAGGCTVTFGNTFTNAPTCTVEEETLSLVNALSYTITTSAITVTQTSLTSKLDYICIGH